MSAHQLCLLALIVLLIAAAIGDWRRLLIPNRLCLAIAALALPWWITSQASYAELAWQLGFALLVFAIFAAVFSAGWMGGGDVKLLAALALWLPWKPFLQAMLATAILGGVLTAALLGWHRLRRRAGVPEIPYGVAICAGALLVVGQGFVNPFTQ